MIEPKTIPTMAPLDIPVGVSVVGTSGTVGTGVSVELEVGGLLLQQRRSVGPPQALLS